MKADVTLHRRLRRRRGAAWLWAARRLLALAATVAALATASVLPATAPEPPTAPSRSASSVSPPAPADLAEVDVALDLAGPPIAPPPQRRRTGVPLDARANAAPDDYEILSAAELDAISQARN